LKQDNSSGYAALRHGAGLIDRSGIGRILLTGADRRSYLQGLLTNDIEALTPGGGCYAAMLTAQGRMMTDMRVLELGDGVLLDVPREVTTAIRDHLDRFVFSEDVQVEDVTGARAEIGIYGPGALDVLVKAGMEGGAPSTLFASTRGRVAGVDAVIVRSDELGVPGYDVLVDAPHAKAVTAALLGAGAVPVSETDAEGVRMESGRPRFGVDMDADTIPLEAGLEQRAISRTKGCYVGQEVIVRVQDRGHGRVAKRLVGLTFDADAGAPAAGARVWSGDREIGRVTSAIWSPALARPIALGYVHRDFVEPGTGVTVDASAGLIVRLPFREP
jgi:tRNA-modifying protein YgfZ